MFILPRNSYCYHFGMSSTLCTMHIFLIVLTKNHTILYVELNGLLFFLCVW